jgi:hypothetical protein
MLSKNYKDYIKTILISLGGMSIVYFYMLCNFWWGNHDWGYLKSGASIESGLFEARYSQHLFTLLFLDGHILPVLTYLLGFLCISLQSILIGKYFEISEKSWVYIALFIAVNPHIYALFYYVYLFFPFVVWSLVGVVLLFLSEGRYKFWKYVAATVGFILLLGSYPPNLALVFVFFVGKRILCYVEEKESFKDVLVRMAFFASQIVVSILVYKIIYNYLLENRLINTDMYNIKTKSLIDILLELPLELWKSVEQLFYGFSFMEYSYFVLLSIMMLVALGVLIKKAKNKYVVCLGVALLLLASRFAFILSSHSEFAVFRLMYWGRLGLYVFGIVVLFKEKRTWVKNILFVFFVFSFLNLQLLILKFKKFKILDL